MKAGGAAILFASLFLTWHTLAPTARLQDFTLETAWQYSVPLSVALTAALDKPELVARLGALAILGSLFMNWYDTSVLILSSNASRPELLSSLDGSGPTVALAIVLVAAALLALARPRHAWPAIGVVVFWLIEPHELTGRGAWLALAGSILAWGGGLMSSRPKITDQCSPATRSSTSPASPASS